MKSICNFGLQCNKINIKNHKTHYKHSNSWCIDDFYSICKNKNCDNIHFSDIYRKYKHIFDAFKNIRNLVITNKYHYENVLKINIIRKFKIFNIKTFKRYLFEKLNLLRFTISISIKNNTILNSKIIDYFNNIEKHKIEKLLLPLIDKNTYIGEALLIYFNDYYINKMYYKNNFFYKYQGIITKELILETIKSYDKECIICCNMMKELITLPCCNKKICSGICQIKCKLYDYSCPFCRSSINWDDMTISNNKNKYKYEYEQDIIDDLEIDLEEQQRILDYYVNDNPYLYDVVSSESE